MGLTKATGKVISDNLDISGIATATNFKTGSTNVHNVGIEAAGINAVSYTHLTLPTKRIV